VKYNENSLLARTYGIFSIEIAGISKIYFIMMENTFRDLEEEKIKYQIYDMKGSTVQREEKNPQASVLKDINYFRSNDCFIYLSKANKTALIDQVTKDIDMLSRHNIMDYSLLLGVGKSKRVPKRKDLYEKGLRGDRI
jgi:1-phosphatidylinositol-4-phosphate 5-kinase